jgi:predicted ATP-dependent protease
MKTKYAITRPEPIGPHDAGLTLEEYPALHYDRHPDDLKRLTSGPPHTTYEYETRMLCEDGVYRWFLVRFFPLCDGDGHVVRWRATGTEIADRKKAEERFRNESLALRQQIHETSMFEEIVGRSPALRTVLARVAKVAPTESTVMITGETGTGKELIARAIHKRSARSERAFVSVNCATIPRELIASDLFGHEKGAFTGAVQRHLGRFELAEGGTLFFDEVGELPMESQTALLRQQTSSTFSPLSRRIMQRERDSSDCSRTPYIRPPGLVYPFLACMLIFATWLVLFGN